MTFTTNGGDDGGGEELKAVLLAFEAGTGRQAKNMVVFIASTVAELADLVWQSRVNVSHLSPFNGCRNFLVGALRQP